MINEMLQNADSNTLLLIDEIISGTNPRQGAALAKSLLEEISSKDAKIVVTTHYSELKDLATVDNTFMNASVSFDLDTLKPTYRLNTGIPGVSYTLEIAKIYNIPEHIIDKAKSYLSDSELSTEALIEKIQRYEQEIIEEKDKIAKLSSELGNEKEKIKHVKAKLNSEIQAAKEGKGIKFLEDINRFREEVSARIKELQGANLQEAGSLQEDLINLKDKVSGNIQDIRDKKNESQYQNFDSERVKIGDSIFVKLLQKNAAIEDIDLKKKVVTVLLGSMRSRFSFDDLLINPDLIKSAEKPKFENKKRQKRSEKIEEHISENKIPPTFQTQYNTVDLRGLTIDEALRKMESGLDKMMRSGIGYAVVIHGHGTGALKESIRSNLQFSFYAQNFRPGEQNEGGDGVTIVHLNR
jgi:DNA mismatch repair protein MutS2